MTQPALVDVAARRLSIRAIGTPAPQGSKTVGVTRDGRPYLRDDNSPALKRWRGDVVAAARNATLATGWIALDAPVAVRIELFLARPKSVHREWPCVKPDIDKLARACLDAIVVAGVLVDDARVVELAARKRYAAVGQLPGAYIVVTEVTVSIGPVDFGEPEVSS